MLNEVIALVLAFAAEFVFYSVRNVELAFEILILQQQVAVQAKADKAVVSWSDRLFWIAPPASLGAMENTGLVSVILVVAAFTAFWRQTEGQRGNP